MKKAGLFLFLFCILAFTSFSQTLFSYGKYKVDAVEFLKAYNKNNTSVEKEKAAAIKEYLDLYIPSRLKIRDAYDRKMDTLPQIKDEVESLKAQIRDNYITDNETLNRLTEEAFNRSQKDILAAHIYVSFVNNQGQVDSADAFKKIYKAYQQLQQGKNFSDVALQYSDDPSVKVNKGEIGYITVFSLPYIFENSIYSLSTGKFSSIIKSKSGYHIFINMAERKAMGKIKTSQILFAFPPDANETTKTAIKKKADSVYTLLINGGDFLKLAETLSNDLLTATMGGQMPEFTAGFYEPEFENAILSINKKDIISKPILSSHGYHIVKYPERIDIQTNFTDKKLNAELHNAINQSDRKILITDALINKVTKKYPLQIIIPFAAELWDYTDSVLSFKQPSVKTKINTESVLLKIGKEQTKVTQWTSYAEMNRYKTDGSEKRLFADIAHDFILTTELAYYGKHLEEFNDDFRYQMKEFEEGNLFFEIMQDEVWGKAQRDSVQLKKHFETNKNKYQWKASADAVIFFSNESEAANAIFEEIKKSPQNWKEKVELMSDKTVFDSGRFEWTHIPNKLKENITVGLVTTPEVNNNDNTASFAYILKLYPQPETRTFIQAKGLVINDYQEELEKRWLLSLKKKYPVIIDQKVLAEISK